MSEIVCKIRDYLEIIFNLQKVKAMLYGSGIGGGGYLSETGWRNSVFNKTVSDKDGNAIPWCTYPYISFIEPRLKKEFSVFEYGCGASSEWYAKRCGSVTSVENDKEWYEIVKKKTEKFENVEILYQENVDEFLEAIFLKKVKYDLIIVDCALKNEAKSREKAMKKAICACSENGVIVLDNSEHYPIAVDNMLQKGFKKIDFYGLSPSNSYAGGCTTIFYRGDNILDI